MLLGNCCRVKVREATRKVVGVSSGPRKEDKEIWWWKEDVEYRRCGEGELG